MFILEYRLIYVFFRLFSDAVTCYTFHIMFFFRFCERARVSVIVSESVMFF